jgi:hypothetical protein
MTAPTNKKTASAYFWDTWPIWAACPLYEYKIVSASVLFTALAATVVWLLNEIFRRQDAIAARQKKLLGLIHQVGAGYSSQQIEHELTSAGFPEHL